MIIRFILFRIRLIRMIFLEQCVDILVLLIKIARINT